MSIPDCCRTCPSYKPNNSCSCSLPSLERGELGGHFTLADPLPNIRTGRLEYPLKFDISFLSDLDILKEFDKRFKDTVLLECKVSGILDLIGGKRILKYLKDIKGRKIFKDGV